MSHLLIVKRLELYMDLALYKINILLLLLLLIHSLICIQMGSYKNIYYYCMHLFEAPPPSQHIHCSR